MLAVWGQSLPTDPRAKEVDERGESGRPAPSAFHISLKFIYF
jgi:hypothetical protein